MITPTEYTGYQDRGQGTFSGPYQPLLFPDEVWSTWEHKDAYGLRLSAALRARCPDAAPPGWVAGSAPGREESGGVGVAGVMEEERN